MKTHKFQNPLLYAGALVIGTLIFISCFLISNQINYKRDSAVLETNMNNFYTLFELGVENDLLNVDICSIKFSEKAEESFYFHRKLINDLENSLGKDNRNVIMQKKIYTIAQAQHLSIKTMQKNKCGLNKTIILFFYSNDLGKRDESERVGSILDSITYHNTNILVYSFDTSMNTSLVNLLMEEYYVKSVPSIVINEKITANPSNIDDLKNISMKDLPLVIQ